MIPIYQVHPAVVHFPIVLLVLVLVLNVVIVARGGSLTERTTLPTTAFWFTWLCWLSGAAAAIFGGIAAGHATQAGFPADPIQEHAGLARLTMGTLTVLAIVLSLLRWRNVAMSGIRGWIFTLLVLVNVAFIVETAAHGGHLVYGLGINVDPVKPHLEPDSAPAAAPAAETPAPPASPAPQ